MYRFQLANSGKGQIQIDDFVESFESDFSFWSKSDYEAHWEQASAALLLGKSALFITSMSEPQNTNFIRAWACYVIGAELVFQENILFLDELPFKFNVAAPHTNVLPYESVTDEGYKISEWRTGVEKI
ncbi:hypothetical protein [Catenovulum agarivorans]|uniref:hypothetical protein n=1 Tax=Catenovulum agarivorans TaxID=1172192 RepID=UPI0003718A64|nr:hypothetical protein [Catenovulum agarivorans]